MGRKKIMIKPIKQERQRQITLNKRKYGLFKKAHELAILCECKVALVIYDWKDRHYLYGSDNIGELLMRFSRETCNPVDAHNSDTMQTLIEKREGSGKRGHHDSDDDSLSVDTSVDPDAIVEMRRSARSAAERLSGRQTQTQTQTHAAGKGKGKGKRGSTRSSAVSAAASPARRGGSHGNGAPAAKRAHLASTTASTAAARIASKPKGTGRLHNHNLHIHVPGSGKPFPKGVTPRANAAAAAGGGGLVEGLPSLGSLLLPTPDVLQQLHSSAAATAAAAAAAGGGGGGGGGGVSALQTADLLSTISPSVADWSALNLPSLNSASLANLRLPSSTAPTFLHSPTVLSTPTAGDLHLPTPLANAYNPFLAASRDTIEKQFERASSTHQDVSMFPPAGRADATDAAATLCSIASRTTSAEAPQQED